MVIPISMFAAGPVRDATRHTTFSPDVQHWWRAMASNCISQGRKCADTVPSNIGTFGLDALRVAVLFNPLLDFIVSWLSLSPRVDSPGVAWTDEKENSGTNGGEIGVLIVGAQGCTNVHTGV